MLEALFSNGDSAGIQDPRATHIGCAALRAGDSEAAARAMLEHLAGAKRAYIAAVGLDRDLPQPQQETQA